MRLPIAWVVVFTSLGLSSASALAADVGAKSWGPPAPNRWGKNNMHLIDRDAATGYEIYRMSKPDREDMRKICALGITEMMVLSGTASKHEYKYAAECPTLRVIYNQQQSTGTALDRQFLTDFDAWVETSRAQGKKIAFRCECGCHRTGRLAAYYQMKYQHLSLEDSLHILQKHGEWMIFYSHIFKQTRALADYISRRACSQKAKYCVRE